MLNPISTFREKIYLYAVSEVLTLNLSSHCGPILELLFSETTARLFYAQNLFSKTHVNESLGLAYCGDWLID